MWYPVICKSGTKQWLPTLFVEMYESTALSAYTEHEHFKCRMVLEYLCIVNLGDSVWTGFIWLGMIMNLGF